MDLVKPILLAEDLEDDARIIQVLLKRAGIVNPVITVNDGTEAVAYLDGKGLYADRIKFPLPSVLLLDLKMPKMDGFEVLEWCKTQPHLKGMLLVVLSGNHEVKVVNRAYLLGAHSFLVKPGSIEEIRNLTNTFDGYWNRLPAS